MPKRIALLIFLVIILSLNTWATEYTADFLNTGVGARALALGSAFTGLANDASAVYWNPSGMVQIPRREITLMHTSFFDDIVHTDYLGFAYPFDNQAVGVGILRYATENIPISTRLDENNQPIIERRVGDSEYALFASYGHSIKPGWSLGGNVKILGQKLGDHSAYGFGVDIGLMTKFLENISLGVMITDITGTYIFWDTGHHDLLKPQIRTGLAYNITLDQLHSRLLFVGAGHLDFQQNEMSTHQNLLSNSTLHGGVEYWFYQHFALRLGMDNHNLTAGAGFLLGNWSIDYAYAGFELGNTHRVSAGFHF